ncbi:MAG TPA: type II toxin-antitoxin system RelE/ParE family toxin [Steroidobacteraceae bacterium]|nr:type II toxin-antitoxin system RelE/ParE family toxin [Steroidobacteraceae bacterium]HQW08750.1 type II toxin-antitoxin system RelE/ParE family toxin [Steroidobacteraceae bacterium]HQX47791.1 type II toxin-antitoxin system RelE/ParE family toxin [Steroidobacteraceae bacterium]HQX77692.1 type II toxin-antitoxin system RelE/ParE family toxin [Steroidobacteraceae bacterium]HQZ79934.1 type II toxin-antitoxin system RelE/ParE family toxin [Steroidobacteraceae bacterium]
MTPVDMAGPRTWKVLLAAAAEADFRDIIRWTAEEFGDAQARVYAETLSAAIESLAGGPTIVGARHRDDIAKGIFALHVARHGHNGSHFVMFRIGKDRDHARIEVLRLLHEAMDLARHLPASRT